MMMMIFHANPCECLCVLDHATINHSQGEERISREANVCIGRLVCEKTSATATAKKRRPEGEFNWAGQIDHLIFISERRRQIENIRRVSRATFSSSSSAIVCVDRIPFTSPVRSAMAS